MTKLAYQLYSSRNFGPLSDTLTMLAELGYEDVEGYGALMGDAGSVEALTSGLDATGLSMPTAHIGLDQIEQNPNHIIELAKRFAMRAIIVPYLEPDERPGDALGWKAFGKRLALAGQPIIEAGFEFGWHNHDFEFQPMPSGDYPIDFILGAGEHVKLEFDLAWAQIAGHNPEAWLDQLGSRVIAAHIKDIAPKGEKTDEGGWADVGTGIMDWPKLYTQLKALGVPSLVVEHDNPSDDGRFACASLTALRGFETTQSL
ncbi:MAG: sugar phosphate isomerase/epimerase [Pseudomonadota bacterium]